MTKNKAKKSDTKKNGFWKIIVPALIIIICLFLLYFLVSPFLSDSDSPKPPTTTELDSLKARQAEEKRQAEFLKASTSYGDSNVKVIRMSEPIGSNVPYQVDQVAGKTVKRVYNGRRINIAITGLDSRLGTHSNHADANHVMSILIDSGTIELTSVPRDTPADAGMPDSTGQNKLTVVRAVRGRDEYHKALADIVGIDKIHYYIETGFSQTMGLIELFGFKDSKAALQVLRSRTGLGGDDYQRCYNQGQFIRQMILRKFNSLNGIMGEILLRGGLALVETNLTAQEIKNIAEKLRSKGFPRNVDDITMRVRPPMGMNFKVYNFSDDGVFQSLEKKIERFNEETGKKDTIGPVNVERKLFWLLNNAARDTAKRPDKVIKALSTYFEQHAWLQISNLQMRDSIREQFAGMLYNAYMKKKQYQKASRVRDLVDSEKKVFNQSKN